jgi:hypothetical protein
MDTGTQKVQWIMSACIQHHHGFKHTLTLTTQTKAGAPVEVAQWMWSGIGIPHALVMDIQARVEATVTEHLVTRYGLAQSLFDVP